MQAVRTLPENYQLHAHLDIKDQRTMLLMNIFGLALVILFGGLFLGAAAWLRPQDIGGLFSFSYSGWEWLLVLGKYLLIILITMVIHEAIHGLGFIWLEKIRPQFAFKGAYAYAAAPGWYLPRNPYLVTGLAPLVVISLLALIGLAGAPAQWLTTILVAAIFNASGAVGDVWVAWLLLRSPQTALATDSGDEISIYAPVAG